MSGPAGYYGWAATNTRTTVADNLRAAVAGYNHRYDTAPAVALLHPKDMEGLQLPLELAALDVRAVSWVARGTVLLSAAVLPVEGRE